MEASRCNMMAAKAMAAHYKDSSRTCEGLACREEEDHRLYPSKYISNKSMEVVNSLDVSAQPIEDLKFMQASNVNVFNFVSVKLSSQYNYHIWKAQMLCLMESQLMRGIIDANI
nr:ankyrin repeat-containing protein [Tanacetum cinerariifolium]